MEIVTGSTGEAHVTPIDDAVRNSNCGYVNDRVVFTYYENLAAQAITANEVRVFSGYGMNQGRIFKIDRNDYDSVTIENGSQGVKRADLIVARYTMDTQTGFEDISLVAIRGQSGSTYVDPSYTTGNINSGDTLDDFPLYRVKINGIVIEAVEALFTPLPDGGRLGQIETKLTNHMNNTTNPHTIAWTEAGTLAAISASETLKVQFGKIAKAISSLISHIGNKSNPHEVSGAQLISAVPVSKGGTGATTAAQALQNLGVPSNVADSMAKSVYCDSNDYLKEGKGGIGSRGINNTSGGVNGSIAITTAGALYATKVALQTTFQAGVDAIFNAVKNAGVTPSASTPTAIATAIGNLRKTPYTATYKPTSRANNLDMGVPHNKRYVDTTAVPNTNSGTYTPTARNASIDMGATNTYRYVNTNSVPNTNSGTYSFPSGDTGATKDLGTTNTYRYVNAGNVYEKGKADAQATEWSSDCGVAMEKRNNPSQEYKEISMAVFDCRNVSRIRFFNWSNSVDTLQLTFLNGSSQRVGNTINVKNYAYWAEIPIPSGAMKFRVDMAVDTTGMSLGEQARAEFRLNYVCKILQY